MTERRRHLLAETLRELANLVVGALVLGQFFAAVEPSFALAAAGGAAWVVMVGFALVCVRE